MLIQMSGSEIATLVEHFGLMLVLRRGLIGGSWSGGQAWHFQAHSTPGHCHENLNTTMARGPTMGLTRMMYLSDRSHDTQCILDAQTTM